VGDDGARGGSLREPAVAEVREENGAIVVRLAGELDLHNADDVKSALERASESGKGRIVVDLSTVEFLDSTVLAVFVQARRRAGDSGGFRLAAPGPEPRRVFQVAGVDRYLDVYDSLADALAAS
jgi:anti-sigma B factor antagonist